MSIFFYSPWPNKTDWLKSIKLTFKKTKVFSLEDKPNFEKIECAIIWDLPNNIYFDDYVFEIHIMGAYGNSIIINNNILRFSSLNNENEEVNARRYFTKYFNKFRNKKKHFFFDMDYKIFFNTWEKRNKGIDFYYYDGEHSYKNQYDNLIIASNFLKKGSVFMS